MSDIINKIEFFPFLDAFFCDTATYDKMTDKCKMDHYFATMRTMAKAMPVYCHMLNKFQSVHVLNAVQRNVGNQSRKPQFVYASGKGIKAAEEAVDPFKKYDESILGEWCRVNEFEFKELNTMYSLIGDVLIDDIDAYFKIVTSQTEPPKRRKASTKGTTTKKKSPTKK